MNAVSLLMALNELPIAANVLVYQVKGSLAEHFHDMCIILHPMHA